MLNPGDNGTFSSWLLLGSRCEIRVLMFRRAPRIEVALLRGKRAILATMVTPSQSLAAATAANTIHHVGGLQPGGAGPALCCMHAYHITIEARIWHASEGGRCCAFVGKIYRRSLFLHAGVSTVKSFVVVDFSRQTEAWSRCTRRPDRDRDTPEMSGPREKHSCMHAQQLRLTPSTGRRASGKREQAHVQPRAVANHGCLCGYEQQANKSFYKPERNNAR